ncbi:hypothetical protein QE357_000991 [Siphonobacter sp. BAB-5404]|nr:hypothetical protein [Siphonobacter sp. SORGH_AS_1065]MDR6193939.1 hypothetical protein [Siphonobacter sp. SORGH_AS_0500]
MKKIWAAIHKYRQYIGVDGAMYLSFIIVLIILFIFFS